GCTGVNKAGPIVGAPTVTADDANNFWVFFGTGRFFHANDKSIADTQYFFGVKDPVVTAVCTQSSQTNCQRKNLLDVSAVTICVLPCASGTNQVTGISGVTTFSGSSTDTLEGKVQSMDGWVTTLPATRERAV